MLIRGYHQEVKVLLIQFLHSLGKSFLDLLPIILVIGFFQLVVLQQGVPQFGQILSGGLMVLVGLSLFVQGLQMALFPLGEDMAYSFVRKGNLWLLLLFAFTLGFGTTVAEPALIAIADEASSIAAGGGVIEDVEQARKSYATGLRLVVALAVGALGIGLANSIQGRDALIDGFGLIAFASLTPMIFVMAYGMFF
jgi:hypothetical protein